MLVERTDVTVAAERADAFGAAMRERGLPALRGVPGVLALSFGRGVEDPATFMLLVTWEAMAAHHAYNATPVCAEIRQLIGGYATGAGMRHFEMA